MEDLDWGESKGRGEEWLCETYSEQACILKVEPTRFDNGLDLDCGEKEEVSRMNPKTSVY